MHIKPGTKLLGIPVVKIRNFFIRNLESAFSNRSVERHFKITHEKATELTAEFLSKQWIKAFDNTYYELDNKGVKLANASAIPGITHSKALKILEAVAERASKLNTAGDLAFEIGKVEVLGSTLDPRKEVKGDVDILVHLSPRCSNIKHQKIIEGYRIAAAGRRFSNIIERMCWPTIEIVKRLKSGTRGLSVHLSNERDSLIDATFIEIYPCGLKEFTAQLNAS